MLPKACWIGALVLVSAEAFMPATSGGMMAALRQHQSSPDRLSFGMYNNGSCAVNQNQR